MVRQARNKDDVPQIVRDFMNHNAVQGGRILVSPPEWTFLVKVFENLFEIQALWDFAGSRCWTPRAVQF